MGDQGVVDDVETHGVNPNRDAEGPASPRIARGWGARHPFAGVKSSGRGKVGGTDWGDEAMPEQQNRGNPSARAGRGSRADRLSGTAGASRVGEGADAGGGEVDWEAERRRRRARFLRELAEARALRDRVQPRKAKAARLRHAMRMRTFRW
ncbi:hypothetical protein GCM10019016_061380 [Streptomyces prasinosporus]|uniref:Uncharacterized protein n=1 Tax=Streptomyces prasinosporus TaxID=68256 RepID=A0ABP6TW09_9ACTN|nr:hypothetical protein GCM10010332_70700 [Streptomyces albogriseolus]